VGVFAEEGGNEGDIVPVTPKLALPVGVVEAHTEGVVTALPSIMTEKED
jgi:hypothetical protein